MITLERKKQLMRQAIVLIKRANYLLDEAYKAHCKATGIKP